jgi:hypothetical protein
MYRLVTQTNYCYIFGKRHCKGFIIRRGVKKYWYICNIYIILLDLIYKSCHKI